MTLSHARLLAATLGLAVLGAAGAGAQEPEPASLVEAGETVEAAGTVASDPETDPQIDLSLLDWGRAAWEFNLFTGVLDDEPEFRYGGAADDFRRDAIFGARVGYVFQRNVFLQVQMANALVMLNDATGTKKNLNSLLFGVMAGYNYQPRQDVQLFATGGIGGARWSPDGLESEADLAFNYGLGGRIFLTAQHAIRTDLRMHHVRGAMGRTLERIEASDPGNTLWALEASFGVSYFPAALSSRR